MAFDVSITSPATNSGGSPNITWTSAETQTLYQIGAYRVGDRSNAPLNSITPPFRFHPVAASGYPSLPYGAIPDPIPIRSSRQSFRFDGAYPSTGSLPNGTYYIWLHVIHEERNADGDVIARDNGVATQRLVVSNSVVAEPLRVPDAHNELLPAPTIIFPTADHTFNIGDDADAGEVTAPFFQIQLPSAIQFPSEVKVAIYQRDDWDFDRNRGTAFPLVYTDRAPFDAPKPRSAEWVTLPPEDATRVNNKPTWTLTFDGSEGFAAIPNGFWVAAIKYNSEITARVLSFNPGDGLVREAHRYDDSHIDFVPFEVRGSFENTLIPDPYIHIARDRPTITWPTNATRNPVDEALPLRFQYHGRVGLRSVEVRRNLIGGTNAGTRYLSRSSSGVYTWVTALGTGTDIPLRTEELVLAPGTAVGSGWGNLAWGAHQFAMRPTSDAGIVGDWSDILAVRAYRKLAITNLRAVVTNGFIVVSWNNGATGSNNRQGRFRIQVKDSDGNPVTGTSERPSDQYVPERYARAILGDDTSFTLNRDLPSKGPVDNGTYDVVLTIWDIYGNQSDASEVEVTVNNTAPPAVTTTPRIYDESDVVQTGTQGYIPGDYPGITFGGITTTIHQVLLRRREFARQDGAELQDEPVTIATLPTAGRTTLERWNDYEAKPATLYEYSAISEAVTGARTQGTWSP